MRDIADFVADRLAESALTCTKLTAEDVALMTPCGDRMAWMAVTPELLRRQQAYEAILKTHRLHGACSTMRALAWLWGSHAAFDHSWTP